METIYEDIINRRGLPVTIFKIYTKKGHCAGSFNERDNRIHVNHVNSTHGLKGLMQILINKFKTNLVTFSPVITTGIPKSVKGELKTLPAKDPRNPHGEDFLYMECVWE